MKPIPKELQGYFPAALHGARPWWRNDGSRLMGEGRTRHDGWHTDEERERIDKAEPIPPPPILVGQVWAYILPARPDTTVVVQLLRSVLHADRRDAVFGTGDFFATAPDLLANGFLLACPFGYAPWSGPEVT